MKIIDVSKDIPSREECGCRLPHGNTLRKVAVGKGAIEILPNLLEELDVRGPYYVFYDETTFKIAGREVLELVDGIGVTVSEPTFSEVRNKVSMIKSAGAVLAVGGGTVIDVGKYVAYEHGAAFISIPTTLSHDGIVSPVASLFSGSGRKSVMTKAPIISLIDLDIVSSAPKLLTASGLGDVLAKTVSIKDWQLGRDEKGEEYCVTAERYALKSVESVVRLLEGGGDRYEVLAEALISSGISMMIAGSSRPASGSEHLFSHYLDMYSSIRAPHGIQCALGTLAVSLYHEQHNPNWWKNPDYGWKRLRRLMTRAEMPLSLRSFGIPLELAVEALVHAPDLRPERYTILHKRRPTREEAAQLIKETEIV